MPKSILYTTVFTTFASILPLVAQAQSQAATQIEEVVVTAQRFEESAQRAPVIITAITNEDLVGVTDVRQLQTVTPGIAMGGAGNIVQTFVRGVGSLNATTSQESAIAYNADGVFLYTSSMISPLMYDLERVEILKGPQGTLYGRNASGGAVNLITRGASLGQAEGYVEGEVGNYSLYRITGAVNVPLSDTLAVRVAGQHSEHEGYLSDGQDDQDVTSGRIRVLWRPSETLTVKLGVDGSQANANGAGSSFNPNPTGDDWIGGLDPRVINSPQFGLSTLPPRPAPHFKNNQWSAFAQIDADLGFATLTVLPAYRYEDADQQGYLPGYFFGENTISKQKSFEARLSNQTDRMRWVAGGYYFKIDQDADLHIRNESIFQDVRVVNPATVESYAFFGEATFSVTDRLRLIGGLRYTHEENTSTGTNNASIGAPFLPRPQTPAFNPFNPVTNPTGEVLDQVIDEYSEANATTWKIGAEFDLTENSLLFATVSRGFKGGGNYVDPVDESSFEPEFLTAYEIGSRNRFFGNTLQVNGELFYWEYKDQQIAYIGFNSIGTTVFKTENAGQATMYGANIDVVWRATANDTFHVGVEYMDSEYDSFVREVPAFSVLPTTHCRVTPSALAGAAILDCSGLQTLRAPEWSGLVSYEHRFDLGSENELVFNLDATFASSRYLDPVFTPEMRQPSSTLVNAALTYNSAADFSVTGWVRNIGEERILTGGGEIFAGFARPTLGAPRTYGLTVRKSF